MYGMDRSTQAPPKRKGNVMILEMYGRVKPIEWHSSVKASLVLSREKRDDCPRPRNHPPRLILVRDF